MKFFCRSRFAWVALAGLLLSGAVLPVHAQQDGARAAYASAAALQEQGLYDLAADAWREMLAPSPDGELAPRVRYNLAVCRFHSGAFAEAAELFATAADAERFPDLAEAAWANLGLARLNAARGRMVDPSHDSKEVEAELRRAVKAFDAGIAAYPTGAQTASNRFYRGETLSLLGEHPAAAESFRAVLAVKEAKPLHRQSQIGLANALLESGAADQVEAAVKDLADDPSAPLLAAEAKLLRAEARLEQQKFREAADDFLAVGKINDFADAAYATERAGFCNYLAKNYAAAAEAYDELTERFPESQLAKPGQVSAGKCWLLANEPEKAVDRLAAAWESAPVADNTEAARWWGRALLDVGRPAEAIEAAQAAIGTKPADAAPLQLLLADALQAADGREAEAADALEAFATNWPTNSASPRALLTAARLSLDLKQLERADRLAKQFLGRYQDDPTATEARVVSAAAAFALGDRKRAASVYESLASEQPDDQRAPSWLLRAAELRRDLKQPEQARASLDTLIDRYTDNALASRARYERGQMLAAAGELPAANADFATVAEAASGKPLSAYARLALATNQYSVGDTAACTTTLQALFATGPSPVDGKARYLLATAHHATKNYAAALESLATAEGPPAERSRLEALCLIGLQRVDDAAARVDAFLKQFPQHAAGGELLHELAWLYRDAGRVSESLAAFGRVVSDYPSSSFAAESSYRVGEMHRQAGEHAEAVKAFETAVRLASSTMPVDTELLEQSLHLLGWSHWNAGERDQAASGFRRQLEAAPKGSLATDGQLMLGECLFAQEKYAKALEVYRSGLANDSTNRELMPLALLHAGQAAGQAGDWQASLKLLERARRWVKGTPLADEAAYERAWALHQLGRTNEAAPEFARLSDQATGVIAARAAFMRGELHFAAKEHQKAVRMFFRVAYGFGGRDASKEYHPWQAESLFEAARCLEQLNRVDPALKLYAELVERFPDSPKAKLAKDRLSPAG